MVNLYRFFDGDGRLLYVGISSNAIRRLRQHATSASWFDFVRRITIDPIGSREDALRAERDAILNEKPVYNVQWNVPSSAAPSPVYEVGPDGTELIVGEPCPCCGRIYRPYPMTNAERQRRHRERKGQ